MPCLVRSLGGIVEKRAQQPHLAAVVPSVSAGGGLGQAFAKQLLFINASTLRFLAPELRGDREAFPDRANWTKGQVVAG